MNKIRFYNDNTGPVAEEEIKIFQKALDVFDELTEVNEITVLIHTKNNTGYLERIFEGKNINPLFKGVAVGGKYPVKIETTRTIDDSYKKSRVLMCFGLKSDEISKYEDFRSVKAILAHQWVSPDVLDWAKSRRAINIDTGIAIEGHNSPNIIVQKALIELTNSINLVTGITHPMDNELCKTFLRALKKYNYDLNPIEIFSFLTVDMNWDSDHAKKVIVLVDKLNSGRSFVGGAKTGLKNYIKSWTIN